MLLFLACMFGWTKLTFEKLFFFYSKPILTTHPNFLSVDNFNAVVSTIQADGLVSRLGYLFGIFLIHFHHAATHLVFLNLPFTGCDWTQILRERNYI